MRNDRAIWRMACLGAKRWQGLIIAIALFCCAARGAAMDVDFSTSGFLTVTAGKMLGGSRDGALSDYRCPCFVSDYAQAGIYEGRGGLQWKPDTKLGVQTTMALPGTGLSLTGQVVARGARDGDGDLEWLYGAWRIDDRFTFQLGRKRLPLFYYSDAQDIGLALPWTHLPPQLYGWEAVNYNGINLLYRDEWAQWLATVSLFAGNESRRESGFWKTAYGRESRTDIKWENIVGGYLALARGDFEFRYSYLRSRSLAITVTAAWNAETNRYDDALIDADWLRFGRQSLHGIAFNLDIDGWLLRNEIVRINYPDLLYRDSAYLVAVGRRLGRWQPMLTHARYRAKSTDDANASEGSIIGHSTLALSLRYDLTDSSAIKIQYDRQREESGPNSGLPKGNARLLTFSYDVVF